MGQPSGKTALLSGESQAWAPHHWGRGQSPGPAPDPTSVAAGSVVWWWVVGSGGMERRAHGPSKAPERGAATVCGVHARWGAACGGLQFSVSCHVGHPRTCFLGDRSTPHGVESSGYHRRGDVGTVTQAGSGEATGSREGRAEQGCPGKGRAGRSFPSGVAVSQWHVLSPRHGRCGRRPEDLLVRGWRVWR